MAIKTEVLRAAVTAYLSRPDVAPRLLLGLSMADIAEAVGIPAGLVKQHEKQLGLILRGLGLMAVQAGRDRGRQWMRPLEIRTEFAVAAGTIASAPTEPAAPAGESNAETPADAKARLAREKSERDAAAAARRRASDFEALKPADLVADDFDTSVANDPASNLASKQAAVEKRQEFSLAMGAHLENLRLAATEEEVSYGALLDAMPVADAQYVGELAEQERRFGNRRMARSLSLYAAGEELSRRLLASACQQYLTGRVNPTGYAARGPSDRTRKRSVCLMLSDLHVGSDLSGRENPSEFGQVEEARRLEYVMRQAIDYKPQYRDDSELVLMLNGDLIDGLLLHDMRDGAPLTEQKIAWQSYMEQMVGEFAAAFPSVRVFCQPGNHGRDKLRHPGRATSAKWDGHETMMYYGLSRACSRLPNVSFDVRFRAVTKIDLHGSWFGLSHGDTEVKLGDPDTKAKDNLAILDKINASRLYGVEFAAWGFGHFHKPRYLPARPRVLFNGALIPPNGHARGAGYIAESQGQWLWEAVEGYPVGDARFIEVSELQDRDERLGTIIKPFRFSMHPDAQIVGGPLASHAQ